MIVMYTHFNEALKWDVTDEKLLQFIPEERREKCRRYHFDTDKKLCLYGSLLLQYILAEYFDIHGENVNIGYGKYGKPYLKNTSLSFNISHTKCSVICAVSSIESVGADAERIGEIPYEVVELCFSEKERETIDKTAENERSAKFYEIWTRKEAYLKYNGTGLLNEMSKLCTFSSELSEGFYTLHVGNYIYNIYSEKDKEVKAEYMSVNMLTEYFLGMNVSAQ